MTNDSELRLPSIYMQIFSLRFHQGQMSRLQSCLSNLCVLSDSHRTVQAHTHTHTHISCFSLPLLTHRHTDILKQKAICLCLRSNYSMRERSTLLHADQAKRHQCFTIHTWQKASVAICWYIMVPGHHIFLSSYLASVISTLLWN